ncbi:MAG: cupin domain-containing protein [Chloroflexi bacterium]|nr:cupin domain-containing protein [Chloroflexota bacterium]
MAEPAILRPSEIPPVDRGGGARTIPLVCCEIGAQGVLNGITEFDPGAAIPLHYHNCEETVLVLEGEATFEVDGRVYELRPLDTTWVPTGVPHRFLNRSNRRLRIFWTYSSVDATRTIVATGETFKIGSPQDRAPATPYADG